MNCDHFAQITGMRCQPVPTRDGSEAIAVITPFTFFDGDGLELFACRHANGSVHLFDDGQTMHWLHSLGLRLGDDRRRWAPLRAAAEVYGIKLNHSGVLETIVSADQASTGFARMISAQLAIDGWAREHAGAAPEAQWLLEEAMLYLRTWKPNVPFTQEPDPVQGLSGKAHAFQVGLGNELIDTLAPHPNATGAELRKLVDVRSSPRNRDLEIRVILDDRRSPEAAKQEASILGNLATTWTMSRLIAAAGRVGAVH